MISLNTSDKVVVSAPLGYKFDPDLYDGNHKVALVELVEFYLVKFFGCKKDSNHKAICQDRLLAKHNISMCLNLKLADAIDMAYEALRPRMNRMVLKMAERTGGITDDIKLVRSVLDSLAHWKVPKEFAGGFLVIYMEFIEGVMVERP